MHTQACRQKLPCDLLREFELVSHGLGRSRTCTYNVRALTNTVFWFIGVGTTSLPAAACSVASMLHGSSLAQIQVTQIRHVK